MKFICKECNSLIEEKDTIIRSDDAGNLIPSCHDCWKRQRVRDWKKFAKSVFKKDNELKHSELVKRIKAETGTYIPSTLIEVCKREGVIYEFEKRIYRLTVKA
jgi:phage pi2 protein 07